MTPTTQTCTAFKDTQLFASGSLHEVMLALRDAPEGTMFLVFDDRTGRAIDIDPRGTALPEVPVEEPRGRGRPKLGVVAREVTLLPRHWDWLGYQPGGASVALRRLVEEARKSSGDRDRVRAAQEAAYSFISAIAGNLPNFEEASRALFSYDRRQFADLIAAWPPDIRDHAIKLAFSDHDKAKD
jgi:hypothetical protein